MTVEERLRGVQTDRAPSITTSRGTDSLIPSSPFQVLPAVALYLAEHPRSGVEKPGVIVSSQVLPTGLNLSETGPCGRQAAGVTVSECPIPGSTPPNITCNKDRYNNDVAFARFSIPGQGPITDPTLCGTWKSSAACSQDPKHYIKHFKNSCDRVTCPTCYPHWLRKAARRMANRLRGYIYQANHTQATLTQDDALASQYHKENTRFLNHYIVSLRPGTITPDMPTTSLKRLHRQKAEQMGITGGEGTFHAYRIKKGLQSRLSYHCRDQERLNPEEKEKKFWELVKIDVLGLGHWTKYVEWSPHMHIVGFGRLLPQYTQEEKEIAQATLAGAIVKWVRHVNQDARFTGQEMHDQIIELCCYLLSHSAVEIGPSGKVKNIPFDFGVVGRQQLRKKGKEGTESHAVVCPTCGSPVVMGYEIQDHFEPQRDEGGDTIPYRLYCLTQGYEIIRPGSYINPGRPRRASK